MCEIEIALKSIGFSLDAMREKDERVGLWNEIM